MREVHKDSVGEMVELLKEEHEAFKEVEKVGSNIELYLERLLLALRKEESLCQRLSAL